MPTPNEGTSGLVVNKSTCLAFLLLLLVILQPSVSAYNSEEHKIIGDNGIAGVKIPSGVELPDALRPQPVTPDGYRESIKFAKRLAVGFDTNDPSDYDEYKVGVQDNYYYHTFAQSAYNKVMWIPPNSAVPATLLNVPTHCGANASSMTFGELVALYGDYRRTVYSMSAGKCAMTDVDVQQIVFNGGGLLNRQNRKYRPQPVAGDVYLRAIGSGLVPPFGTLGSSIRYTAGLFEYTEAGWWGDEMVRIAAINDFHFSSAAIAWYVGLHRLALVYVEKARDNPEYWVNALHYEACALHALTDLFAFGHVVVNRGVVSQAIRKTSGTLDLPSVKWMEHSLRVGGAVRAENGRISLDSALPPITEVQTTRVNTMTWKLASVIESLQEKKYHDTFNRTGAIVKNLRGDTFKIHGDGKLRDTPRALIMGARAVEESVQSLFDAYVSLQSGQETVDSLGQPGSPLFRALKVVPVYVDSDPDRYFLGQFAAYAKFIDDMSGAGAIPADWQRCQVQFIDGHVDLPPKRETKCTEFGR